MPDNDIRAAATELLASVEYARLMALDSSPHPSWADRDDVIRESWRAGFRRHADVLVDAGWRPPGAPTPTPLPSLLYLTDADGHLVAIDGARIMFMRTTSTDPRGVLTRVQADLGGGCHALIDVRETIEDIGAVLAAVANGATAIFAGRQQDAEGETDA